MHFEDQPLNPLINVQLSEATDHSLIAARLGLTFHQQTTPFVHLHVVQRQDDVSATVERFSQLALQVHRLLLATVVLLWQQGQQVALASKFIHRSVTLHQRERARREEMKYYNLI